MVSVRVFVSSLMSGDFDTLRDAACDAISLLGYEALRAEDYVASPTSAQVACLAGVRSADAVVLILGSQYGVPQASGLSATHEEYREARETSRPVFAFIAADAQRTPAQAEFIREVRDWEQGQYTSSFHDAADLQAKVTQGLHRYALTQAAAPTDETELAQQARALIPARTYTSRPLLVVAVAAGPAQQVIRPAELESEQLRRYLQDEAHAGTDAVLSHSFGTDASISGDAIVLEQRDSGAKVTLSETGDIMVAQPATTQPDARPSGMPSIIEEEIAERVMRALLLGARVLDHVDPRQRISHVAVVAALLAAGYLPWRTRADHDRNPNTATMGSAGRDRIEAELSPPTRPRAALSSDIMRLSQDLTVRLRRSRDRDEFRA